MTAPTAPRDNQVDALRKMPGFSILDLCPIPEGGTAADAFRHSLDLAQHAEAWGYQRFWLAEHHNMPGIASAATSVVIAHVAAGTRTIRVGAGGIMLPNHSPLIIAEQFGTLATLFPDRIDLGLGRAPGTDPQTARALRRDLLTGADHFPQDVIELQNYFAPPQSGQRVRAVPGAGLNVPIWLLGSSLFSAQLAAQLGLPFAFASHFAPADLMDAIHLYRNQFKPSPHLPGPYVMAAINVIAADTDSEARRLFTSLQQAFVNLRRGTPGRLPSPIEDIAAYASPIEITMIDQALSCSVIGSPESVIHGLQDFIARTQVDELMITANIYEHAARLKSFGMIAKIRDLINADEPSTGQSNPAAQPDPRRHTQ
jgi:luciferase family oxidoreductase group 1